MKTLIGFTTLFLSLVTFEMPSARAAEFRSICSGAWDNASTWDCASGGTPQAGDTAIVRSNDNVTISANRSVDSLTVESGGILTIDGCKLTILDSGGLTVNGSVTVKTNSEMDLCGGGTVVINGIVILDGDTAELSVTDYDLVIDGSGEVLGKSDSARFNIDGDIAVTLTTKLIVGGAMEIRGLAGEVHAGKLVNNGLVEAHNPGGGSILLLDRGLYGGIGVYAATTSGSVLRFRSGTATAGMGADFEVKNGGLLKVESNISTTGKLRKMSGSGSKIRVGRASSIKFNQ